MSVTLKDKIIKEPTYEENRLHQLNVAHNSTVLVYARQNSEIKVEKEETLKDLARKLRPELGRFFLSADIHECFKLLRKHNDDDNSSGIDMVIVDHDIQSVKLVDAINKRPLNKDTAHLPLISLVVIEPSPQQGGQSGSHERQLRESRQAISDAGGASLVLPHNTSAQTLLYACLDILQRRRNVEGAFRVLKAAKTKAAKYPYLPVFSSKYGDGIKEEGDSSGTDDDFADFEDSVSTANQQGVSGKRRTSISNQSSGSVMSLKDMDDWTDSSSLLPDFVQQNRKRIMRLQKTRALTPTATGKDFTTIGGDTTDMSKTFKEERHTTDKNLLKYIQNGKSLDDLAAEVPLDPKTGKTPTGSGKSSPRPGQGTSTKFKSASAKSTLMRDTLTSATTLEAGAILAAENNGSEEKKEGAADADAEEGGDGAEGDKEEKNNEEEGDGASTIADPLDDTDDLDNSFLQQSEEISHAATDTVDDSNNPPDDVVSFISHDDNKSVASKGSVISAVSKGSVSDKTRSKNLFYKTQSNGLQHLFDMRNRPRAPRKIHRTKSLLDEPSVSSSSTESNIMVSIEPFIHKGKGVMHAIHSVGGLNKAQASEQWRLITQRLADDTSLSDGLSLEIDGSIVGMGTDPLQKTVDTEFNYGNTSNTAGSSRPLTAPSVTGDGGSVSRRKAVDPAVVEAATKTIKRMARDSAPDVQLNELLSISLHSGKVTVSDRDLLDSGVKCESEGLMDQAIQFYKRAGLHTTKLHLSKIFLANVHYKMGKFIQSLEIFDAAIASQAKVKHLAIYSREDDFIAYYNRALVNFRLGNDTKGLEDISTAVELNRDHLKAREIKSLAYRRMGLYEDSINMSKGNELLRKEIDRQLKDSIERERETALRRKAKTAQMKSKKEKARKGRNGVKSPPHIRALISRSSKRTEHFDMNDITTATRIIQCDIEEKGGGTMKSRKLQRQRNFSNSQANIAMPGEALKMFKMTSGFYEDIYETHFNHATPLQEALLRPPGSRNQQDLDTIATTLGLFPFLRSCGNDIIKMLANVVEYRPLQMRTSLFMQNTESEGVCFLLNGSIEGKLETNDTRAGRMVVNELMPFDTVGHIDLLFSSPQSQVVIEMYRAIAAAKKAAKRSKDSFGNDNESVGGESEVELKSPQASPSKSLPIDTYQLPRSIKPGMFITYTMQTNCEVLIIPTETYSQCLQEMAAIEFRRMLDSVEGCGIFNDWSKEERIRLARMGTARVYRSGDLILKQGVKPTNLYLIMKGMAKSYKSPNKSTVLGVKLTEARERAAAFDMKYTYDHTSRDALSHGKLDIHPKATEKHRKIQMSRTHVTVSEAMRYSLGVEIHSLEKELQKAIEAEQRAAEEEPSMDDVVEHVTAKLSEVSTLQWPMLFGEACVSDPENGTSRGTIIADTTLEVLCIHKSQLQTFRVRQNLLERLKYRSVIYPEDEELLKQKEQAEEWEITRQGIVSTMSKVREEYLEPFYV